MSRFIWRLDRAFAWLFGRVLSLLIKLAGRNNLWYAKVALFVGYGGLLISLVLLIVQRGPSPIKLAFDLLLIALLALGAIAYAKSRLRDAASQPNGAAPAPRPREALGRLGYLILGVPVSPLLAGPPHLAGITMAGAFFFLGAGSYFLTDPRPGQLTSDAEPTG